MYIIIKVKLKNKAQVFSKIPSETFPSPPNHIHRIPAYHNSFIIIISLVNKN